MPTPLNLVRRPLVYLGDAFEVAAGYGAAASAVPGGGGSGGEGFEADGSGGGDAGGDGGDDTDASPTIILDFLLNSLQVACATFEGSIRGGNYTLCGFSEYSSPSSPPKKYKVQTISGEAAGCYRTGVCGQAGGFGNANRSVFTGASSYNPAVSCGALASNTQNRADYIYGASPDPCTADAPSGLVNLLPNPFFPGNGISYLDCGMDLVSGPIQNIWTGACGSPNCAPPLNYSVIGSVTAHLTSEDTEADAIARLLAGSSWSAYSSGTQPLAKWQTDRAAFTGEYVEARFQGTAAVPQGLTRFVLIGYYRRPYGSGSFVKVAEEFIAVIGGVGNVGSFFGTVTNPAGFETYAQCESL